MTNSVLTMLRLLEVDRIVTFDSTQSFPRDREEAETLMIRHPFPVLDLEDGTFLLLQDTDRFRSLTQGPIRLVPVQVCARKSLRVTSPKLALVNFTYGDLQQFVEENGGAVSLSDPKSRATTAQYAHLYFEFPRHRSVILHVHTENQFGCPDAIAELFRRITRKGTYLPDNGSGNYADTVLRSQTFSGNLTLPPFKLTDLEQAALSDQPFPAHAVTVQTDRRVFNIDFPLSVLCADISVEEKEQFLKDMVLIREQSCRTTFFEGQVYILNR